MSDPGGVPHFPVELEPPDIQAWTGGNTGVPGFTTFGSALPGPHVALVALLHGNEIAGAVVLDRLMRAGVRPRRGSLTLGFANLAAFARWDPRHPTASRFLDEDMNRVWDPAVLDGPRRSSELDRARELRPLVDTVDVLLDLHSMLWPSDPLILCGPTARGLALASSLGVPGLGVPGLGVPRLVVADRGHVTGPRLMDYPRFTAEDGGGTACLVEAGQHWQPGTVTVTEACVEALLRRTGLADAPPSDAPGLAAPRPDATGFGAPGMGAPGPAPAVRRAEVTTTVTAATGGFTFLQPFRGGDVVPRRNTLIALDGTAEIRTPHDDCLLVMPSLRPSRGHTAVRLARFL